MSVLASKSDFLGLSTSLIPLHISDFFFFPVPDSAASGPYLCSGLLPPLSNSSSCFYELAKNPTKLPNRLSLQYFDDGNVLWYLHERRHLSQQKWLKALSLWATLSWWLQFRWFQVPGAEQSSTSNKGICCFKWKASCRWARLQAGWVRALALLSWASPGPALLLSQLHLHADSEMAATCLDFIHKVQNPEKGKDIVASSVSPLSGKYIF